MFYEHPVVRAIVALTPKDADALPNEVFVGMVKKRVAQPLRTPKCKLELGNIRRKKSFPRRLCIKVYPCCLSRFMHLPADALNCRRQLLPSHIGEGVTHLVNQPVSQD